MPHADLPLHDLPADTPVRLEQDGAKVVVIRSGDQIYAYQDVCPHAFWPLSEGIVTQGVLECPGHGWEFSVETGMCLNAPAYCLTPVALTVEGENIRLHWELDSQQAARSACQK